MSVVNNNLLLAGDDGYQISRSVRLRSSASASLQRTFTTPTSGTKWTYSLWMKKSGIAGTGFNLPYLLCTVGTGAQGFIGFGGNQADDLYFAYSGAGRRISPSLFRDPAAWYHLVFSIDTAQATEADRAKLYVNGVQFTWTTSTAIGLNDTTQINQAVAHNIGRQPSQPYDSFDGYLAEVNFIDGQALTPSSFGEFNALTGVWQPKAYAGTYGTNGFYLNFKDNASTSALGTDYSGNGNTWTTNNISLTAGATYDSMIDVPTPYDDGGNGRGNYATWNPLQQGVTATYSNGNLTAAQTDPRGVLSTIGVSSGKWYWEIINDNGGGNLMVGVANITVGRGTLGIWYGTAGGYCYFSLNGQKWNNSVGTAYGASYTNGDIIGVALDLDGGTLTFYKNGVSQGTAFTGLNNGNTYMALVETSVTSSVQATANFGQRPFAYTPPTGFKALNTQNLPEPVIAKGDTNFSVVLDSGANIKSTAEGVYTHQLAWIKDRANSNNHQLIDSVRGTSAVLQSNTTAAETTYSTPSGNSVGWVWAAPNTGVTNTAGSITSTVSANPTAGFSIVTYAGTGANATVGHGLGVAPRMVIFKLRSGTGSPDGWGVYHASLGASQVLLLESTAAASTSSTYFNNTAPTSSVMTVGTWSRVNNNGGNYVAYCFSEVPGYSRFGSYTGNGSADGPFVFCGFRPAYILLKNTTSGSGSWCIYDTKTGAFNVVGDILLANSNIATNVGNPLDILSNGFKLRNNNLSQNQNASNFIFAAFAEHPFKNALAR